MIRLLNPHIALSLLLLKSYPTPSQSFLKISGVLPAMPPLQRTGALFVLFLHTYQAFALNAAFYDVTSCGSNSEKYSYYNLDTGGDDGACYNVGDNLGTGLDPPYCEYFTYNADEGGSEAQSTCPGPGAASPFDAHSVGINLDITPVGTVCAFCTYNDRSNSPYV